MKERTYLALIAPEFITADSLILVWMIKSLHRRMALVALQTLRALVPSDSFLQDFTIFG